MATNPPPVRSNSELEYQFPQHNFDIEDDASIGSDDTIPSRICLESLGEIFKAIDTEDTSGNFDPAEESRRVGKSNQFHSKSQRGKSSKKRNATKTKDKPKPQSKQQTPIVSPPKKSSRNVPAVKSQNNFDKPRNNGKSRRCANPLRPEDYLTQEDFQYLDDSENLRALIQLPSYSPSPEVLEDSAGHKGVVTKIKTSFTHPIEFCLKHTATDCNFCEIPTFCFVGFYEKEIYCIHWDNGLGFTQLSGGDAQTTTTMCQDCTIERVQIIFCGNHEICCINSNALDFEETAENLIAQEQPHMIKQQLSRWCSMCFSPATYACRTRQLPLLTENEKGGDEDIDGCGLRLCTSCETKLREVFGGDVGTMAATLDQESKVKEDDQELYGKIRADVGLLCRDGILMRNVENASSEHIDEEANI